MILLEVGMNLADYIDNAIDENLILKTYVKEHLKSSLIAAAEMTSQSILAGNKLLICGNGGSAADAQHIATEFTARLYKRERPAMAAIALTTDTSAITAIGNDYGFDRIFERQAQALCQYGDIMLGISTSGNSPNVIHAIHAAMCKDMKTIAFLGGNGGEIALDCVDVCLIVPSTNTMRIQEVHIMLGHLLCQLTEELVYPK